MKLKSFFSGFALVFICLIVLAVAVSAQGKLSDVRIYPVDATQFPQMRVRVAPVQADGTLAPGLGKEAFRVYEDGAERPVEGVSIVERGAQVAFVLDASGSINFNGATRRLRSQEAIEAIDDLVMTDKWVNRTNRLDRWLLVVPKGDKDFRIAQDWTDQPIAIHNSVYSYDYKAQTGDTPLYVMLIEALARIKDVPDFESRPKFLVVLSDGVDRANRSDISDVINRANLLGVKVISIKLGPEAEGATSNLYRLAKETNGVLVAPYTGLDALRDAYGRLKSQRSPYEVVYRSAIGVSGKHAVAVGVLVGGQEVRSAPIEFGITVDPSKVRIVEPASPLTIERVGDRWDADPKTLSPRDVTVKVEVTWPDGRARAVPQKTYLVDGVPKGNLGPDQSSFVWDFSELAAGAHALVVEIKDELGVTARSELLQANISIELPPAPTPTPLAPVIERVVDEQTSKLGVFSAVALGIAGIALLLAIYVMIKYRVPQRVGSAIGDVAKAVTDPFIHRKKGTPRRARAELLMLREDGSPGERIPIMGQSVTLGRDPARAQIVLADTTVSRLHARIEEETTGVFKIIDEGGSQGTYVNEEPVGPNGRRLMVRDEIELGGVRMLFQPSPLDGTDQTEPSTRADKRKARSGAGGKSETLDRDDTVPEVRR
jgi:hypothetical protein